MNTVESCSVDHTKLNAPLVRISKKLKTKHNDDITVFDLRFCKPNHEMMPTKGMHTLEHLLAVLMRKYLNDDNTEIIDISPMACRTGFYMSVIGCPSIETVIECLHNTLNEITTLTMNDVQGVNEIQCGSYREHSFEEMLTIINKVMNKFIAFKMNN